MTEVKCVPSQDAPYEEMAEFKRWCNNRKKSKLWRKDVVVVRLEYNGKKALYNESMYIEVFADRDDAERWIRWKIEEIAEPQLVKLLPDSGDYSYEVRDYRGVIAKLPDQLPNRGRVFWPDGNGTAENLIVDRRPGLMVAWWIMERAIDDPSRVWVLSFPDIR